jgi:hypothetical protein
MPAIVPLCLATNTRSLAFIVCAVVGSTRSIEHSVSFPTVTFISTTVDRDWQGGPSLFVAEKP